MITIVALLTAVYETAKPQKLKCILCSYKDFMPINSQNATQNQLLNWNMILGKIIPNMMGVMIDAL